MIDVGEVLRSVPEFDSFCSVHRLHALIRRLREDTRFEVRIAGESTNGLPIHHVRFGHGSVKALFVGFQHCMEPLNGLTIFSLIALLMSDNEHLARQDVEWNFIPCIDPDGALLNEPWTQKPFSFKTYMRGFHQQPRPEQVDLSFPITYKKITWDKPSQEAQILQSVLDGVHPDFFYPGHDARPAIGSWYYISRDINHSYYAELYRLLARYRMPLIAESRMRRFRRFAAGVYELHGFTQSYDGMEEVSPTLPQSALANTGAASYDYLSAIKPNALSFVGELTNIRYVSDNLSVRTGRSLREIHLQIGTDNRLLAATILEEWDRLKEQVATQNAFYDKIVKELVSQRHRLHEGLTSWHEIPTQSLLSDPAWAHEATEADRLEAYIGTSGRFGFLCHAYEFVRLLQESAQTPDVKACIQKLVGVFDDALAKVAAEVDFNKFEAIDCSTLAKAHTGSALVILNAVLDGWRSSRRH